MNSNNKFGLEYAGPRRVRRGWWMTVLTALTLLTLAALAGWLWSWVRHAAVFGDVMPPMRRAGFPDWVAFVAVGVVVVFLVARLVWDAWMERREAAQNDETRMRNEEGRMPEGMSRADAARIARAAAAELELCRRMVDGALRSMCVEDYGDALQGVSRRLAQVRVTLRELGRTFDEGRVG